MKYYEKEFSIKSHPDLIFRFKKMSPIDLLAIANDVEMFAGTYDSELYKKYLTSVLENTEVKVKDSWLPVKEGGNYYPAYLSDDLKGLREIVNNFFTEVIRPVFTDSSESVKEPE